MLKLVFVLIVLVDNEEVLPEAGRGAYWSSIYVCSKYAEAVEHQLTTEDDARRRTHYDLQNGQVNISAYCIPRWVPESANVFDH